MSLGVTEPLIAQDGDDLEAHQQQEQPGLNRAEPEPEKKPEPRRLLSLALQQWRWLLLGCAALVIRLPFSIVQPHLVSVGVIGSLLSRDADALKRSIILFVIAGTIDAVLDFWCVFVFSFTKTRIIRDLRNRLFGSILRQDAAFFDNARTGDILSRLTSDTVEIANDLTWVFRFSIEAVVRITGVVGYMFAISPPLAAASCLAVPLVALGNRFYGKWLHNNAKRVQAALAASNAHASEIISAAHTVISFAAEYLEARRYAGFIQTHYTFSMWQAVADGVYYMLFSTFLMQVAIQTLILVYGSWLVWHRALKVEEMLAFLLFRAQLQEWTGNLLNSFSNLIKSSGAAHQVFLLLERPPRLSPSLGTRPASADGSVVFQDVHFAYPTRLDVPVLRGLSFEARPGEVVALTGPSGAGKSTCFHLLEHFYEPDAGRVLLEGHPISDLDHGWLHAHVGLVGQEPVLFSGTILQNIMYALLCSQEGSSEALPLLGAGAPDEDLLNPEEVPQRVIEAAKVANAHDFIMGLPKGYHTEIGERGVQLSGGQKQRVAIARAVLQNPAVLLLDEATSSLDAESEALVQAALERVMQSRTTLVIAHRLSTVRNADKILVLSGGRVVESGTHAELMAKPPPPVGEVAAVSYRALVKKQFQVFEDDAL